MVIWRVEHDNPFYEKRSRKSISKEKREQAFYNEYEHAKVHASKFDNPVITPIVIHMKNIFEVEK